MQRTAVFGAVLALHASGCVLVLGDDYAVVAGSGGGGAGPSLGPVLLSSTPANGETEALIASTIELYFDRPVNGDDATGRVHIATAALPEGAFAEVYNCPFAADPTCLEASFPESVAPGAKLPGDTAITVTIDKALPDTNGNTNAVDTIVSYTTFAYRDVYADTGLATAVAYAEETHSVYLARSESFDGEGPRITGLTPSDASDPFAPLGELFTQAYPLGLTGEDPLGIDAHDNEVFLAASDWDSVLILPVNGDGTLGAASATLSATGLAAPDDVLDGVEATTHDGSSIFFSQDYAPLATGLLRYDRSTALYELWLPHTSFGTESSWWVAASSDGYLYLTSGEVIQKYRIADKTKVNEYTFPEYEGPGSVGRVEFRTDAAGRLYYGTPKGLTVFDTSGDQGFTVVARRDRLPFARFDLREEPDAVYAYATGIGYDEPIVVVRIGLP